MSRIVKSLSYQQSVVDYPYELGETRDYPPRWHNALCRHFWVLVLNGSEYKWKAALWEYIFVTLFII
jgi:hypothetical protein